MYVCINKYTNKYIKEITWIKLNRSTQHKIHITPDETLYNQVEQAHLRNNCNAKYTQSKEKRKRGRWRVDWKRTNEIIYLHYPQSCCRCWQSHFGRCWYCCCCCCCCRQSHLLVLGHIQCPTSGKKGTNVHVTKNNQTHNNKKNLHVDHYIIYLP